MSPDLRAYVERAVENAPPLTPEQVQRLALLLRPALREQEEASHE